MNRAHRVMAEWDRRVAEPGHPSSRKARLARASLNEATILPTRY